MTKGDRTAILLRLPPALLAAVDDLAKRKGVDRTAWIVGVLERETQTSVPDQTGWLGGQAAFSDMPDSQLGWIMRNLGDATPSNRDAALAELTKRNVRALEGTK